MKEMIYQKERLEKPEILDAGIIDGRKFYILSLGTHPTAYVELKEEELEKCPHYDNYHLDVHCGFTFLNALRNIDEEHIFIGWDYAHFGDYMGYYEDVNSCFYNNEEDFIKWSTKDILEEVKYAIKQLNNGKFVKHEYYTFEYNED